MYSLWRVSLKRSVFTGQKRLLSVNRRPKRWVYLDFCRRILTFRGSEGRFWWLFENFPKGIRQEFTFNKSFAHGWVTPGLAPSSSRWRRFWVWLLTHLEIQRRSFSLHGSLLWQVPSGTYPAIRSCKGTIVPWAQSVIGGLLSKYA